MLAASYMQSKLNSGRDGGDCPVVQSGKNTGQGQGWK